MVVSGLCSTAVTKGGKTHKGLYNVWNQVHCKHENTKTKPGNLVGATPGLMVAVGGKGPNASLPMDGQRLYILGKHLMVWH